MLRNGLRSRVTLFLLGCLTSGCVFFAGASDQTAQVSEDSQRLLATFADIRIEVLHLGDDSDSPKVMTLSRNGKTFLGIYENREGKAESFVIAHDRNGLIARADLSPSGVSTFAVFGHSSERQVGTPVFWFEAADTPGRWETVTYARTKPTGTTDYYPIVGEAYEDLDFDGQFDAQRIYNSKSEIVSMSIRLDGAWEEICRVTDAGLFRKVGKYYPNSTMHSLPTEHRGGTIASILASDGNSTE